MELKYNVGDMVLCSYSEAYKESFTTIPSSDLGGPKAYFEIIGKDLNPRTYEYNYIVSHPDIGERRMADWNMKTWGIGPEEGIGRRMIGCDEKSIIRKMCVDCMF